VAAPHRGGCPDIREARVSRRRVSRRAAWLAWSLWTLFTAIAVAAVVLLARNSAMPLEAEVGQR
jgi:type IV secretory pathway component VirB8